jgi:hypothetical protein
MMEGKPKEREGYSQQSELEERGEELRRSVSLEMNWKPQSVMLIVGCTYNNGRPTKSVRRSAVRRKT